MLMLISRKAIVPVWLIGFGVFALLGPPLTLATGILLLFVTGVALTIMLVLWKDQPPTIAEVLHQLDASRTKR